MSGGKAAQRGVCIHLGPTLRDDAGKAATVDCLPCQAAGSKAARLVLHACAVHGTCTLAGKLDSVACCMGCQQYETAEYHLVVSANGIGDHLTGMAAAAAWKRVNPSKFLRLIVRHRQWVDLLEGPDAVDFAAQPGSTEVYPHFSERGGEHFVRAANRVPLEQLTLKPLPADAVAWAEQHRGCVVLAPFTLDKSAFRTWPIENWLVLERSLRENYGIRCVAIGTHDDVGRLTAFPCEQIAARPATHVAALMRASRCVVANESGMAHLAGAVGAKCVMPASTISAAGLPTEDLHRVWASVRPIVAPRLADVTVDRVLSVVLADDWRDLIGRLCVPSGDGRTADRRPTKTAFLKHLESTPAPLIVETGCQRADDDYGAGMSTRIFGLWLRDHGGRLISVDNDAAHVAFARARVGANPAEVIHADSVAWLYGNQLPINGLYLDSLDTYCGGHQEHCLTEAKAAMLNLADDAVILIDDTWRTGDGWTGKGALAVPWLVSQGWQVIGEGWQVLLRRA